MKNYFPVVVILVVLLVLACSAGCSSKETSSQRESVGGPPVTQTHETLNTDHTTVQSDRSIPSPPITRPQVSPGSTLIIPTGTTGAMIYENVSGIMVTAQEISAAWDPDGLTCTTKSCTAGFVNNNGDVVQVQTTLYESVDAAKAGYMSEKQNDASYRIIPLDIPDESYGWMQKSESHVVFRKNNAVVIVDYSTNSGPASITMAREFAALELTKL